MPHPPHTDPFEWFESWFNMAKNKHIIDPNAMALATVAPNAQPSLRIVLLKDFDRKGFVFYTHATSRKGTEFAINNHVALNFYWRELDRQIRIEGQIEAVDEEQADEYFASRPRLSQIGAWASLQSQPLKDRVTLLEKVAEIEAKYKDNQPIPRPPHWRGWRVKPTYFEYWQAGEFRLHDRWEFVLAEDQILGDPDAKWQIGRLNP